MSDKNYNTYSSKPSMLSTGFQYGVNEMVEDGLSMGLQSQRQILVSGVSESIENEFVSEIFTSGMSASIGFFTGKLMEKQEALLESAFTSTRGYIISWYAGRGFLKDKLKGRKGRGAVLLSKFLGSNDKRAEECRLIADVGKMDIDTSSNSHSPLARQNTLESKFRLEQNEISKENARTNIARIQLDGMRDSFELKLKTSSFSILDKPLIKDMIGVDKVDSKTIHKLNALSSSMAFEDSSGNWVGGNEAIVRLINGLGLHRAV